MIRNYLITALRNLVRNRLYAAINIAGLTVGFAAAIFAGLFVRDELTFDRWVPDHQRVFLVTSFYANFRGVAPQEGDGSYGTVAANLKLDFPEVAAAARIATENQALVSRGDVRDLEQHIGSADPELFAVLPVPTVAGQLRAALERPDGVVLTRNMARKYFGTDAPIGERLTIGDHTFAVTAVIEDWPSNTTFDVQMIISGKAPFSVLGRRDAAEFNTDSEPYMMMNGGRTYVRLKPGANINALERELPPFVDRHIPKELVGAVAMHLRPLASLHLYPIGRGLTHAGLMAPIIGIAGLGVLIVVAAGLNFINMMTARAARRAVEVGVRKVAGAERIQLIAQFVGEALIAVALGMIMAMALVETLLPAFQGLLRRAIPFDPSHDPQLCGAIAAAVIGVGVAAGFYPAFVLSAFRPAMVLKGQIAQGGSGRVRQALVVVQFAILISLAAATSVIYRQTDYAMNENLQFDKDLLLVVDNGCYPALKTEIAALPGVRAAACSWNLPGGGGYRSSVTTANGTQFGDIYVTPIDLDYFKVYGLKSSAGRLFERQRGSDEAAVDSSSNPTVILNETAVRQLGFASPEAAVGQTILWRRMLPARGAVDRIPLLPSEIVGVVPDFKIAVRQTVQPLVFYADERMSAPFVGAVTSGAQTLNVHLDGQDVPDTLKAIDALWSKLGRPGWPIRRYFIDQKLEEIFRDIAQEATLFTVFAGLAMALGALGLFGLSAFTVEQRTKEIGIRKAMGASRREILGLLLWQFAKPVLWANLIAWPAVGYLMQRWLEGFAYHIDLRLWMFLGASAVALAIAIITVIGHALLVARAQPVTALRYE